MNERKNNNFYLSKMKLKKIDCKSKLVKYKDETESAIFFLFFINFYILFN